MHLPTVQVTEQAGVAGPMVPPPAHLAGTIPDGPETQEAGITTTLITVGDLSREAHIALAKVEAAPADPAPVVVVVVAAVAVAVRAEGTRKSTQFR